MFFNSFCASLLSFNDISSSWSTYCIVIHLLDRQTVFVPIYQADSAVHVLDPNGGVASGILRKPALIALQYSMDPLQLLLRHLIACIAHFLVVFFIIVLYVNPNDAVF